MTFMSGFRRHVGFLALFTVLTSSALNTLTLARFRTDERQLHMLQCSLLAQLYANLRALSTSSRITLSEQERIARRLRSLQLDPLRLGISSAALPSHELQERARLARLAEISWTQALFGAGTQGKVRSALGRAVERLRGNEVKIGTTDAKANAEEEADLANWLETFGSSDESAVDESRIQPKSKAEENNANGQQAISNGSQSLWTKGWARDEAKQRPTELVGLLNDERREPRGTRLVI